MLSSRPPVVSFIALPSDILSQITLSIIRCFPDIPTLQDLNSVRSLLLTGRTVYHKLSLNNNPDLYANIWKLMFDFDSAARRMGSNATVSSSLASELSPRVEALRKIQAALRDVKERANSQDIDCDILIRLFMMLTENDEKNRVQFLRSVKVSCLSSFLCSYAPRGYYTDQVSQSPRLALIVALMWLGNLGCCDYIEGICLRNAVLDLIEPCTFQPIKSNRPLYMCEQPHAQDTVFNIKYFGRPCYFKFPTLIPFARLCTVDRYNMAKREISGSSKTCGPTVGLSSSRFDHDMRCYLRPDTGTTVTQARIWEAGAHDANTLMGLWEGSWFMAARINTIGAIDMCTRPMQCSIRAYISFDSDATIPFPDESDGAYAAALDRAWFPKGTVLDESATSLKIFDPEKGEWILYYPSASMAQLDDATGESPTVFDTIIVGNTLPAHGQKYGEFTFHGRMRRTDCKIALLRKPLDPQMDHIGTWLFYGEIHGGRDFVGNWGAVSETKYPDAANGWFRLSKVEGP